MLQHEIGRRNLWPFLKAALKRDKAVNLAEEVREIASELYEVISHDRRLIRLLSTCSRDVPEIADFHTHKVRGRYLDDFCAYLKKRNECGQVKADVATPAAARALIEMVAWMAAHRHNEPIPMPASEAEARSTVQALFVAALT